MDSERKQDEQTSPTEQEEETNTPATEQSHAEEASQEVVSENVQDENKPTLNEVYNQAPVITSPKEPDVRTPNTTVTTDPLLSSSNKTSMKFFVRNLEGHNDVICDVACRGSVLVSGGYVFFDIDFNIICVQVQYAGQKVVRELEFAASGKGCKGNDCER